MAEEPGHCRSLEEVLLERDVACSECGYNLRGGRGGVCPECGARYGWGVFGLWGPRSDPRMFRAARAGVTLSAMAGIYLAAARAWPAVRMGELGPVAVVFSFPILSLITLVLWARSWPRVARWSRAKQARVASAVWLLLALELLVIVSDVGR